MKISTRILVSLICFLVILGGSIITIAYSNTQTNTRMFIDEYERNAYGFYENELKTIVDTMRQIAQTIYQEQKALGTSDEEIQKAILTKFDALRFFNDKSGYVFVYKYDGTAVLFPTNKAQEGKNFLDLKDSNGVLLI